MSKGGKLLLGVITGAVAGVVASILFTPKSGKEVRKEILEKADDIRLEFDHAVQERREELETEMNHLRGED